MRKQLYIITTLFLFGYSLSMAQDDNAVILKTPTDWRYEKIDLPLDFAPSINYVGFEELRFAPGMFDLKAEKYFTYVFVISIEDVIKLPKQKARQLLYDYYRGLCDALGRSKKISIDTSKINITLKKSDRSNNQVKIYTGKIKYFDTFNNGEEIILNIELETIVLKKSNQSYIIGLVSPKSKDNEIWETLHDIRKQMKL